MWVYPIIKCTDVACNLKCDYCFYRYMDQSVRPGSVMSEEVLEKLIRDLLEVNRAKCEFLWHGGEPLLAGLGFFKKAIEFQGRYNRYGTVITNSIQTNGTLINEAFAEFFKQNGFRVGISFDGPESIHDHHRKTVGGRSSFHSVLRGVKLCQEKRIPLSVVAVVTAHSVQFPEEIYRFFLTEGIKSFSFNPAFEPDQKGQLCDFSVQDAQFADFMERVGKLWLEDDNPNVNIRQLSEPLKGMLGGELWACIYSGQCSRFLDIYPNGDVKPCHSFLGESMRLGNILDAPLTEIIASGTYQGFQQHVAQLPQECLDCEHFTICHGGCSDHRNVTVGGTHHEKYVYCGSRKRVFGLLETRLAELGVPKKDLRRPNDSDERKPGPRTGRVSERKSEPGLIQLTLLTKERR